MTARIQDIAVVDVRIAQVGNVAPRFPGEGPGSTGGATWVKPLRVGQVSEEGITALQINTRRLLGHNCRQAVEIAAGTGRLIIHSDEVGITLQRRTEAR